MKKKALVLAAAFSFVISFISVLNAADTLSGSVFVSGAAKDRMDNAAKEGIKCLDWFLCLKPFKL